MRALLIPILTLLLSAGGPAAAAPPAGAASPPACSLSRADQAWLDRAMKAWDLTSRKITHIARVKNIQAVIFDAKCRLISATAMNGGPQTWRAASHSGKVALPNGETIPANVISFANSNAKGNFFVMSTPSVWRAGDVNEQFGLNTLMVAVLLHEGTHVAQFPTYGARMAALSERYHLPESFNDDSIQLRFQGNPAIAASVTREIDLLLRAAVAPDRRSALKLAREARALMIARQDKYYPAKDAYLREAEDIWLTLEGSAQWAGYQWVIRRDGGAIPRAVAFKAFGKRGKWWSQEEGFALFMALDRLSGDEWKRHVFGDGAKTGLQMLDQALAAQR
ncbi:MAG: hypothetical protein ABIO69_06940 [Sphingomicrobium sp.]